MVLWDDTRIVPCDSQLWAHSAHRVATEQLNATRTESLFRCKVSAIHSKRALFPYNDSFHVNYSAHKVSVS